MHPFTEINDSTNKTRKNDVNGKIKGRSFFVLYFFVNEVAYDLVYFHLKFKEGEKLLWFRR